MPVEAYAQGFSFVLKVAAYFATPVLAPWFASINTDYTAGGFTLGVVMIAFGAMLLSWIRKRNEAALRRNAASITLSGARLPRAILTVGLLTAAPCVFIWIDLGELTWLAFTVLGGMGILAFLSTIYRQSSVSIDAFGIRFPDLWKTVLPWGCIKDVRLDTGKLYDWLVVELDAPLPHRIKPVSRWLAQAKLNAENTEISIGWNGYHADQETFVAFLRMRLSAYRDGAARREPIRHPVLGPDEAARALREFTIDN